MLKVTKVMQEYVSKNLSTKTREAMRKFNNHVETASTNFPKGLIIAGALASSMLQACTVKEKDFGDDIIIDDSVSRVFMKKVDDTLSDLGIIIAPKKSLEDVKSIYFKSSEGEYYFLEPKIISEKEIYIRQIKYNEDLSKEEYSFSIKQNNRSVDLEVVQNDHKEDYQILVRSVRDLGSAVPPLVNAYMNLSSTMMSFGSAINHPFGGVDETGILITLKDIYHEKKERHISTYEKKNTLFKRLQFFAINRERRRQRGRGLFGRKNRENKN